MPVPVKSLHFAKSFDNLQEMSALDTKKFDKTEITKVIKSTKKLYQEAEKFFKGKDEERAFFHYYRVVELVMYVKRRSDSKKHNELQEMAVLSLEKAESLKASLNTRYEAREQMTVKVPTEISDSSENPKEEKLEKIKIEPVTVEHTNDSGYYISARELYQLIIDPKSSFIVMDTRESSDFEYSHIKDSRCINIPSEILKPGILATALEKNLPKESLEMWKLRKNVDHVILMDWETDTKDLPLNHPLFTLEKAMCEFDLNGVLIKQPLLLKKGYKDFMFCYPMYTTKALYDLWQEPSNDAEDVPDISSVHFPDFETVLLPDETRNNQNNINRELNNSIVNSWIEELPVPPKTAVIPPINRDVKPKVEPTVNGESKNLKNLRNNISNSTSHSNTKANESSLPKKPEVARHLKPTVDPAQSKFNKDESNTESRDLENRRLRKELEAEESKCREVQLREQELREHLSKTVKNNEEIENKMKTLLEEKKDMEKILAEHGSKQKNDKDPPIMPLGVKKIPNDSHERLNQPKVNNIQVDRLPPKPNQNNSVILNNEQNLPKSQTTVSVVPTVTKKDEYTMPLNNTENSSSGLTRSYSSPNVSQLVFDDKENVTVPKPNFDRNLKPMTSVKNIEPYKIPDFNPVHGNSIGRPCTGLRNLGNTCYMNSTIQCLSNTRLLADYFTGSEYKEHIRRGLKHGTNGEIVDGFAAVVRALWQGSYKYISVRDFKNISGRYIPMCIGSEQQDSHEFLVVLMDKLHIDLNRGRTKDHAPNLDSYPMREAMHKFWTHHISKNYSIISKSFEGLIMSSLVCLSCRKASYSFEAFSCLSLPISSNRCSLTNCIKSFLKPEKLSGEAAWDCPDCKQKKDAEKVLSFCIYPKVLIIQLKRFSYEGMWRQKLQTFVSFSETLEFPSDYKNTQYKLYGIVNHFGYLEGGHYTAYCKNPVNSKWYKYDDQEVTEMSSSDIYTSAAYLLFYVSHDVE